MEIATVGPLTSGPMDITMHGTTRQRNEVPLGEQISVITAESVSIESRRCLHWFDTLKCICGYLCGGIFAVFAIAGWVFL